MSIIALIDASMHFVRVLFNCRLSLSTLVLSATACFEHEYFLQHRRKIKCCKKSTVSFAHRYFEVRVFMAREWLAIYIDMLTDDRTKEAILRRHGVMKKLTVVLVCLSILMATSGCQRCRLFRRGARCGTPTFKMPSFRATPPCNGGCNTGVPADVGYETVPSTGFSESGVVDGRTITNYPIYTEGPIVTGKTVVGPESEIPGTP